MLREEGSFVQPRGIITPDDSWHIVGDAGKPAFENSWVAYDSTETPLYLKDASGVVHIQGRIKSGSINNACFTLPKGYRPDFRLHLVTNALGAAGHFDILADGSVLPVAGNITDYSISCSFYVG